MRAVAIALCAFGFGSTTWAQGIPRCSSPTPGTVVECVNRTGPGSSHGFPWARGASPYPTTVLTARDVQPGAERELVVYGFVATRSASGGGSSVLIERIEGDQRVPHRTVPVEAVAAIAGPRETTAR